MGAGVDPFMKRSNFVSSPLGVVLSIFIAAVVTGTPAFAAQPQTVFFPTADGGRIAGDLYGSGSRGVVLAHGAVFDKESWAPLARRLESEGYLVLAIDFRGYGPSKAGSKGPRALDEDVLAAIRAIRRHGAKSVSVLGGSMGGGAAARAAIRAKPGDIDRLVFLSPVPIEHPEEIHAGRITFIASRGERLFPRIKAFYERAPQPKALNLLEGNAHAQNIFATKEGPRLTRWIVDALTR